ncbi:MAG: xanthine dehydrogenase family protein molybdopterin-binding subunit [Solirubrobacterales bacterium]
MRIVGKAIPKIDGMSIATGKPVYTEDLAVKGTLIVKILRSPHAFAEITSIDVSRALSLEGVECVLTYKDVPDARFTLAGQSYPEPSPYDRLILDKIVRYVGDEVAIVAAVDEKTALKALRLIKVEYKMFEPVLDFEKAEEGAVIHPENDLHCNFDIGTNKDKNIASHRCTEIGNVEEELKKCSIVLEETYYTQAQAQAMMETHRSFTALDHMGRLVVTASTQIPFHVRRMLARALKIPASKIRVIKPRIGGGFGAKQTACTEIFPAIVTLKTGKPALLVYERKETFNCSTSRHAMRVNVKIGADLEGFIRVMDIHALSDTGAYGEHASTVVSLVGDKTLPLYNKTRAVRFTGHVVYTNKMPAGALRGYGATQGTFAVESTISKLAEKLKMDPIEIRLKNLIKEGENSLYHYEHMLGSSTLHKCIETGKKLIEWDKKYPKVETSDNKVRGIGMAVTMQGSGIAGIDTASVEIRLNDDGNYTLLIGSTDMGTGSDTILCQMAAETLETNMDDFNIIAADTDISPYDPGSYASSTTYVTGMAVVKAATELREKILAAGAEILHIPAENAEFLGDKVQAINKEDFVSLKKIAEEMVLGNYKKQLVGFATYGSKVSPPPFIAGFAEVEVDKDTGKAELLQFIAVTDCGTVINPALARIQVEGGIVQGIGMAMYEDVRYDFKGNMQTNTFMQYKIPARNDVKNIKVFFEESYEPTGPFGAKSVGEVVVNTPSPAIANAIYNAVGVRITNLPITPEKIFMKLTK